MLGIDAMVSAMMECPSPSPAAAGETESSDD